MVAVGASRHRWDLAYRVQHQARSIRGGLELRPQATIDQGCQIFHRMAREATIKRGQATPERVNSRTKSSHRDNQTHAVKIRGRVMDKVDAKHMLPHRNQIP